LTDSFAISKEFFIIKPNSLRLPESGSGIPIVTGGCCAAAGKITPITVQLIKVKNMNFSILFFIVFSSFYLTA